MCGFTGYFDPNFNHEDNIITSMTNVLQNRGPDSYKIYTNKKIGISLGHRRLSIQDLSANGIQPMQSENNRFVIVFNGEIYNHLEIRKEIKDKNWKSTSDTETLLASIEFFGLEKTLNLINGMFAFCLFDSWEKKLHLCRDRYGEKPLYYGINNGVLFFGSQPKSFKPHPKWEPKICSQALNEYLLRGYTGSNFSIYEGIYKLMPACLLSLDLENINLFNYKNYWEHKNFNDYDFSSPEKLIEQLDIKLNSIVKKRTISDRKIGSFLSGGIDSTLITYYLQKQFKYPIDTFTIGFDDLNYDESESAKKISRFLGTNHNEAIFTSNNLINLLPKLYDIWDEPFADPSQLPTLLLAQLATNHVKVAFSGDGGDELFCGYSRYNSGYDLYRLIKSSPKFLISFYGYFFRILRSDKSLSLLRGLPDFIRPNSIIDRTQKLEKVLKSINSNDFYSEINTVFTEENNILLNKNITTNNEHDFSDKFQDYREYMIEKDIMEYLPNDILTKVDRASMFNGLEVRVPFLDHDFASWARNIPINLKKFDGRGKWPLRKLLSSKIPQNLYKKPKKGFGIPLDKLITNDLKEIVFENLSARKIKNQGIFDFKYIKKILDSHYKSNAKFHNQIWNLLVFQLWYEKNIHL